MLAYRKSDCDALGARMALDQWAQDGVLDESLAKALAGKFPSPFHTPNVFIRIGLFIFGSLCASAAFGLVLLMTSGWNSQSGLGTVLLVFAAALFAAVEMLIRKDKPYFRAGLEEAFLYGALICLIAGILILLDLTSRWHYPVCLFMACISAAAAWRYADSLLAALALGLGLYAIFDLCSRLGSHAAYVLPLLVISLSACLAYATGRAMAKPALRFWQPIWTVLRFLSLLTCYAGGNYFVIRELGHLFFNHGAGEAQDVPLAPVFYAFTFGLPIAYIAAGMVNKDRIFLLVGLLTAALAVATFKYYHHVLPTETALVLAGLVLIAIAWIALRAFKKVRFGLTADQQRGSNGFEGGLLDGESLALLQSFASKDAPQAGPAGLKGGGGGFGGGGASGIY